MGKEWDGWESPAAFQRWCLAWTRECLRVLRPGGYLLAFGGTRTYHRLACAIEDAGLEVRDSLHWVYGSGFPKSLDVSKAIDKAAGAKRPMTGRRLRPDGSDRNPDSGGTAGTALTGSADGTLNTNGAMAVLTAPATGDAARWEGWGTALKPSHEPIVLARKPLAGTVARNVLEHGTGALNIDGCRVEHAGTADLAASKAKNPGRADMVTSGVYGASRPQQSVNDAGRWPSNVLLTHSADCQPAGRRQVSTGTFVGRNRDASQVGNKIYNERRKDNRDAGYADADGLETVEAWDCAPGCPVAELDRQSGVLTSWGSKTDRSMVTQNQVFGDMSMSPRRVGPQNQHMDSGGASRFFPVFRYQAKAPASERPRLDDGTAWPTVKPLELMRWLVRLVTPPGGTVLDPFCGTGTTGEACALEGFSCLLVERDPVAAELAVRRLGKPVQPELLEAAS